MKMTQHDLAALCGVSQPQISKLLGGRFPGRLQRYLELFRTFERADGVSRLHRMYPDEFDPGGRPLPAAARDGPDAPAGLRGAEAECRAAGPGAVAAGSGCAASGAASGAASASAAARPEIGEGTGERQSKTGPVRTAGRSNTQVEGDSMKRTNVKKGRRKRADHPGLDSLPDPSALFLRHPADGSSAGDDGTGKGRGRPRYYPQSRACHDCGRATSDYRCESCRRQWRVKHKVHLEEGGIHDFGGVIL